jgi:hypothetical protein
MSIYMSRHPSISVHRGPAFAVVFCSLAVAERADACGALPCAERQDVQPTTGSTGVPLNTQLRVLYFGSLDPDSEGSGCDLDLRRVRLVPNGGEPMEMVGALSGATASLARWVTAQPPALLSASTEYSVQLALGGGDEACSCAARDWVTVSTFTTGFGSDEMTPSFAGLEPLQYGARSSIINDCGGSDGAYATAVLDASDASPGLRYNVYVDDVLQTRYVEDPSSAGIFVDCSGTGSLSAGALTWLRPGERIEVRAVDLAGHESEANEPQWVADVCNPGESEAAPAEGCDLSRGEPTRVGAGLWALLALLGRRHWKAREARR